MVYVTQGSSDVETWLKSLKLQGYAQLFIAAGYKTCDDLENLKGIDLTVMGITKTGTC